MSYSYLVVSLDLGKGKFISRYTGLTPFQTEEEIIHILSDVKILQDLEFETIKDIARRIRTLDLVKVKR